MRLMLSEQFILKKENRKRSKKQKDKAMDVFEYLAGRALNKNKCALRWRVWELVIGHWRRYRGLVFLRSGLKNRCKFNSGFGRKFTHYFTRLAQQPPRSSGCDSGEQSNADIRWCNCPLPMLIFASINQVSPGSFQARFKLQPAEIILISRLPGQRLLIRQCIYVTWAPEHFITDQDVSSSRDVAVIGPTVVTTLFGGGDPTGQTNSY